MGIMSKMKKTAEAPAPAPKPAAEPEDVQAQLAALEAEAAKARAALGADVPAVGVVPDDAPPSEHPLPQEEPKKQGKGRPKGSKNKPKQLPLPTAHEEGEGHVAPDDECDHSTSQTSVQYTPSSGFLLEVYVDCVATFPTKPLHPYLAKICRDLCDEHGALDVRCAPADSHLAFGRWKGYVAERIRQQPPDNDSYSLDTRGSEIAEVAADVLREIAPVFVRGIR